MEVAQDRKMLAWDQAPQWGYAAKRRNVAKKSASESSRVGDWGREGAAERNLTTEPGPRLGKCLLKDKRAYWHPSVFLSMRRTVITVSSEEWQDITIACQIVNAHSALTDGTCCAGGNRLT